MRADSGGQAGAVAPPHCHPRLQAGTDVGPNLMIIIMRLVETLAVDSINLWSAQIVMFLAFNCATVRPKFCLPFILLLPETPNSISDDKNWLGVKTRLFLLSVAESYLSILHHDRYWRKQSN